MFSMFGSLHLITLARFTCARLTMAISLEKGIYCCQQFYTNVLNFSSFPLALFVNFRGYNGPFERGIRAVPNASFVAILLISGSLILFSCFPSLRSERGKSFQIEFEKIK